MKMQRLLLAELVRQNLGSALTNIIEYARYTEQGDDVMAAIYKAVYAASVLERQDDEDDV
jgi:hypothetical protein